MAKHIRGRYEGSISTPVGIGVCKLPQLMVIDITRTFKTKLEALTWLRDMQAELQRGLFIYQGSKALLKDDQHDWLETSRIALRPKTADSYSRTIQKHIIPDLGDVALKDLTPFQVEKVHAGLII